MSNDTPEVEQLRQMAECYVDPVHFIRNYCYVFNAHAEEWIRFDMWQAQEDVIDFLEDRNLVVILKARQLGLSWLALAYALWMIIFRPAAVVGIFSRIETDAQDLLDFRLKGMYDRLPSFMKARRVLEDNKGRWRLSNGSTVMAFATTGGRSYTFSLVIIDEADFQPDLPSLIRSTKPTIDAGGRMIMLSTADKKRPSSTFKSVYRAAKRGLNEWGAVFLPWSARPERTPEWYEAQKRDALANTGSLDDIFQEYPATDSEALAPRSLDKRLPGVHLERAYREAQVLKSANIPSLPGLHVYRLPEAGRAYVIGLDPAEGNPNSDESSATVLEFRTGEEVASLHGRFEPGIMASYTDTLGRYYNLAPVLPERNNHGHAVILWLEQNGALRILPGHDGKPGWLSNKLGKALLYNTLAESLRDETVTIHGFETYMQLSALEGSTLRAPDGEHDDRADSFALADVARLQLVKAQDKTVRVRGGNK